MNLLNAMTHARVLSDNLTAAYYLDMGKRASAFSTARAMGADDQFLKLAAALGYSVEKIEAVENSHAA